MTGSKDCSKQSGGDFVSLFISEDYNRRRIFLLPRHPLRFFQPYSSPSANNAPAASIRFSIKQLFVFFLIRNLNILFVNSNRFSVFLGRIKIYKKQFRIVKNLNHHSFAPIFQSD